MNEARFWSRVEKTPDCWFWKRAQGYGYFQMDGKGILAHRLAYELLVGPIPAGLELDHLCGRKNCVNPEHLEAVTHQENCLRGYNHNRAKETCNQGHLLSGENLAVLPRGTRRCRECARANNRRYYQRATQTTKTPRTGRPRKVYCD